MSYRNAGRRRQTKGVVLFTVVAIMLFLLIMIMSTLSVVSSAQKRTYTKFKENQAYFTARSGLESVTTSLWNRTYNGSGDRTDPANYDAGNNELYRAFLEMMYPVDTFTSPKRGNQYIDTDTSQTFAQMDANDKIAKITVEFPQPPISGYTSDDLKYLYGECTVYIQKTGLKTARFISHATLGDTESTIILYVGPKEEPPDVFDNALTTFGGAASDNMQVYGGTSVNLSQVPTGNPDDFNTVSYTNSNTTIQGNQYFNCNMVLDNAKLYPGANGTVVAGHLEFKNNGTILPGETDGKVYIGGKLSSNTGPTVGDSTHKVDIYCNGINMANDGFKLYGDLYIYGNDPVVLNGTIYGNVYHMGTGAISVSNKLTVTKNFYTRSTAITVGNGLNYGNGSKTYGAGTTVAADDIVAPPSGTQTKDEVLATLPTLDSIKSTFVPYDEDASGKFNAWGYKKKATATSDDKTADNYEKLEPSKVAEYKTNDGWVEWSGYDTLPDYTEPGYKYIDATTNDVNYHVSASYSSFIPNNKSLIIKGNNNVNFYFEEGTYYIGNGSFITNESIYNTSDIVLTTDGGNNISLKTNMNFWGASTLELNNDGVINAYILAPDSKLKVNTATSSLPNVSTITYDSISVPNNTILGMGSLVFNEVDCANAPKFFFVRKPSTKPSATEPGKFWQDIYYFNR